jgi:putative hydrolase of the HAD superfamily
MRAVIFDLFHTLTGPESEWPDLPRTSDVLGIDRRTWDRALTTQSRWRLAGEENDPLRIVSRLAHAIDPTISDTTIRRAIEVRTIRFKHALGNIPARNIETLKALRSAGFPLGLVSNADAMEVAAWAASPLAGMFDAEVFSCVAGYVKPEPAIFLECVNKLGVRPEDCVFVGDGGADELLGARSLGMKTVFMSGIVAGLWPERVAPRMAQADFHVERIEDVLEIVGVARGALDVAETQ